MLTGDLNATTFRLVISYDGKQLAIELPRSTSGTLASIIQLTFAQHGLPMPRFGWAIQLDGRFLRLSDALSVAIPDIQDRNEVRLALIRDLPFDDSPMLRRKAGSQLDVFETEVDSSGFELALGDVATDDEDECGVDLDEDADTLRPPWHAAWLWKKMRNAVESACCKSSRWKRSPRR